MNASTADQMAVLCTGLRHQDKEHRARCVCEIAKSGSLAIPELILLLRDADWRVRYRAAEALGMIHDEGAVPDLITACSDEKDHVRYMAAKALGFIRSPKAVPVLIQLLTDEHRYTRGIASEGLASIGDIAGKCGIESALEHETDPGIRDRMMKSLNAMI